MKIVWIDEYLAEAEKMIYDDRVNDALTVLTGLLYDEPGYGKLHNHLGWAYLYYKRDEELAELHLKMAIRFDEEFPAPYLHLASLYTDQAKYTEALRYLEMGVAKPKADKLIFYRDMANLYELSGKYRKAIGVYREALASSLGYESHSLIEGIKRCRKKRWALLLSPRRNS